MLDLESARSVFSILSTGARVLTKKTQIHPPTPIHKKPKTCNNAQNEDYRKCRDIGSYRIKNQKTT